MIESKMYINLKVINYGNQWLFFLREEANTATTAFCLRKEKDDQKVVLEDKDLEVIGSPIIKYGDSTVIVQHSETGLWLSYKVRLSVYLNFYFLFKIYFPGIWDKKERCRQSWRETGSTSRRRKNGWWFRFQQKSRRRVKNC